MEATRWTAWPCRRRSSLGSATTSSTTTGRSRRSASSRALSGIPRTECDHGAGQQGEVSRQVVPPQARVEGPAAKKRGNERGNKRRNRRTRSSARGQAHAGVGFHRLHASEGRRRPAPRGAEEAVQRPALQRARSVRAVFGRLDRRRAHFGGDAGDAQPGAHAPLRQGRKERRAGKNGGRGGHYGRGTENRIERR